MDFIHTYKLLIFGSDMNFDSTQIKKICFICLELKTINKSTLLRFYEVSISKENQTQVLSHAGITQLYAYHFNLKIKFFFNNRNFIKQETGYFTY